MNKSKERGARRPSERDLPRGLSPEVEDALALVGCAVTVAGIFGICLLIRVFL